MFFKKCFNYNPGQNISEKLQFLRGISSYGKVQFLIRQLVYTMIITNNHDSFGDRNISSNIKKSQNTRTKIVIGKNIFLEKHA